MMTLEQEIERHFLSPESQGLFPLQRISDLEKLFEIECLSKEDPCLAVISIILGAIEQSLVNQDYTSVATSLVVGSSGGGKNVAKKAVGGGTLKRKRGRGKASLAVGFSDAVNKNGQDEELESNVGGEDQRDQDGLSDKENQTSTEKGDFPPLELDVVQAFFLKFLDIMKTFIDLKEFGLEEGQECENSPKELVQMVSNVTWLGLGKSYKADSPHLQSLFTYISTKKLDSFGVALAVVAGSQLLGLKDVHLALSEDHTWVSFGKSKECLEVSWHGKGLEDKRGKEVGLGEGKDSWLYLKGHHVNCKRHTEVATIVASINYSINASMYSVELMTIQQNLLWMLYGAGFLKQYPMGLITLAELEESNPTQGKPECQTQILFEEAISSNKNYYANMHIYPYTFYAGYRFRRANESDFKACLKYWAHGARIAQRYRRSKTNDEELYRELLDISTDFLTTVMKTCATGFNAHSIVRDPMCFAHLLIFFDGICSWEERSKSSIVHITWGKAWVSSIGRFDYTIRRMVKIEDAVLTDMDGDDSKEIAIIENEFNQDSGIERCERPVVHFFSNKMRQLKGLFPLENFSPSAINLILTAQTAMDEVEKETNGNGSGPSGRSRRDRLSQTNYAENTLGSSSKAPTRKKTKLST